LLAPHEEIRDGVDMGGVGNDEAARCERSPKKFEKREWLSEVLEDIE
jgi:hypothetical protein